MPVGSELRFRYDLNLIPDGLKGPIAKNEMVGRSVCIAYLDRSDQARAPEIVPCREAKLRNSKVCGDFCVLTFELAGLWFTNDTQAFNKEIQRGSDFLPHWDQGNLVGYFCQTFASEPTSLTRSSDIADWQRIIKTLKAHSDFANRAFFYFVEGVFASGSPKGIPQAKGVYQLTADRSYDVVIIQYAPGETNEALAVRNTCWLLADSDNQALSFTTTKKLTVDSGYDEKILRVRTGAVVTRLDSMISLFHLVGETADPKTADATWDFDIRVKIVPNAWAALWKGLLLGGFLALQGLVLCFANPQIQYKTSVSVLVVIAGLLAGLVASFGLRKP